MKDLVKKAGLEQDFHIESAATSTEEIGNPVYPPARKKLAEHGIDCTGKTARQLRKQDYRDFDLLIGMDRANISNMKRICGGDPRRYSSAPGSPGLAGLGQPSGLAGPASPPPCARPRGGKPGEWPGNRPNWAGGPPPSRPGPS